MSQYLQGLEAVFHRARHDVTPQTAFATAVGAALIVVIYHIIFQAQFGHLVERSIALLSRIAHSMASTVEGSHVAISKISWSKAGVPFLTSSSYNSEAPPGLYNSSNACYQNSVIQGLAALSTLPPFLESISSATHGKTVRSALLAITTKLNQSENAGHVFSLPQKLKAMSTFQQQDAQEYFAKIMDQLEKEARSVNQRLGQMGLETGSIDPEHHQFQMRDFTWSDAQTSMALPNPVEGLIAQIVRCTACGYSEGLSMIPFNCLTVSVGEHFQRQHIGDCLSEYTKKEYIDGVECPKCTLLKYQDIQQRLLGQLPPGSEKYDTLASGLATVQKALLEEDFSDATLTAKCSIPKKTWVTSTKSKEVTIARTPEVLILHVNRSIFTPYGEQLKNLSPVAFGLNLDVQPWCLDTSRIASGPAIPSVVNTSTAARTPVQNSNATLQTASHPRTSYILRAAVTHRGNHHNGHYICHRLYSPQSTAVDAEEELKRNLPTPRWWTISDESAYPSNEDTVMAQGGVFMLFYELDSTPLHPASKQEAMLCTIDNTVDSPLITTLGFGGNISDIQSEGLLTSVASKPQNQADEYGYPSPPRTPEHCSVHEEGLQPTQRRSIVSQASNADRSVSDSDNHETVIPDNCDGGTSHSADDRINEEVILTAEKACSPGNQFHFLSPAQPRPTTSAGLPTLTMRTAAEPSGRKRKARNKLNQNPRLVST